MRLTRTVILKSNNMVQTDVGSNDQLFALGPETASCHLGFLIYIYYKNKDDNANFIGLL